MKRARSHRRATLFWPALVLLLTAACDRNLYVGRDVPKVIRDAVVAGEAAPAAQEPMPPEQQELDAGMMVVVQPALPMQPTAAASTPPVCEPQHADCDHEPSNGCEADLSNSKQHCGACGTACQTADCSCENGKLTLRCDSGHADCDADVSNGCEVDLSNNMQHCGACKRLCHTNGHDAMGASCVAGRCKIECEPRISPEVDCDGNPDNGCETYLDFDAQNCGKCGNKCARCEGGVCVL
ncbi:MAG TPA: hypothetical protein VFN67_23205 [Polyangiales bacterium]|nr:hypothetical protein [Polyangiales bacterium]